MEGKLCVLSFLPDTYAKAVILTWEYNRVKIMEVPVEDWKSFRLNGIIGGQKKRDIWRVFLSGQTLLLPLLEICTLSGQKSWGTKDYYYHDLKGRVDKTYLGCLKEKLEWTKWVDVVLS